MTREYRGVRSLVYARVLVDDVDSFVTGPVKPLAPVSEIAKDIEMSSEVHFYDNVPGVVIEGTSQDTITISTAAIDDAPLADITGQFYDEERGLLVEGERLNDDYYAIGYVTKKTDGTEVFVWRMKGKFTIPSQTNATEDDGTDANGQELVYTGVNTNHRFALTKDGVTVYRTTKGLTVAQDTNPQDESNFFSAVQTPETISSTTTLGTLNLVLAAGSTSGKTEVDAVTPAPAAGRKLVYKIGSAAQTVTYNQVLNDWTALQLDADITASEGQVITVAEVAKADNKAKKVGSATVVVA